MELVAGLFILIAVGVGVAGLVFWIWALIKVIQRPNDTDYLNGSQIIWVLCLLFLNLLGAILYLVMGHPPRPLNGSASS